MSYVSQVTVGDGETYELPAQSDRTLVGIAVPELVGAESSLCFVNSSDDEYGYALTEDAQTVLSAMGGSDPAKRVKVKAFGEDIQIQILQEWTSHDDLS